VLVCELYKMTLSEFKENTIVVTESNRKQKPHITRLPLCKLTKVRLVKLKLLPLVEWISANHQTLQRLRIHECVEVYKQHIFAFLYITTWQ